MEDPLANSSSSFRDQCNCDVFLSFTGQDTRHTFTGNLYNALCQKGIHTFIDDEELKRGERISDALPKAIGQSRISIIIFSENYAFSSWCLDELVNILQCKAKGQLVWPVFYKVDPSVVRHQRGSFGIAMAEHEGRFKGDPAKVKKWRWALTEAAELSGLHFKITNGYEFKFIEGIIEAAFSVLNHTPLYVAEHPVGLQSRISELSSLLGKSSNDKRMIGIHGLGGVGKTTLAKALYNEIADQYDGASFVADVGENSSKRGLLKLQEEFLAEIIGKKNIDLCHVDRGIPIIQNRLSYKKVLLILDDVQKSEHLEKLAGSLEWFGPGSRIIVTTRDRHLLMKCGEKIYEVQKLNDDESLELFCRHAFNRKTPSGVYAFVAKRAVSYANGLPLALTVIGSNFYGKETNECMCALNNYERILPDDIRRKLQMSYDNLGENEKEIFLDLACFFNGEELGYVNKILKASGFDPISGIRVLIDKSLIKIEHNKVKMHDLVQDMGRAIVRQSPQLDPGKRSRLWHHKDIIEVLTEDTGTKKIEGIMLELDEEQEVHWSGDAFKKMQKLRILVVRNAVFSRGPTYLPNSLKVLEWIKYPSPSLPEDFDPTKLLVMSFPNSRLTSLKPFKELGNLTIMDFSGCELLEKIPDMLAAPNLTVLKLDFCRNLVEIHYSVGYLSKLVTLSARSCIKLKSLPFEMRLMSLEHLDLGGFSCLQSFPDVWEELENISVDRQGTAIEEFPSSLGNLSKLKHLGLDYCTRLWNIPSSIGKLTNLTSISMVSCPLVIPSLINNLDFEKLIYPLVSTLNLRRCSLPDEALPVIVCCFPNVVYLNLSSNDFVVISACINELKCLQRFHVDDCILLKEIKGCPPKLALLSAANCDRLTSESTNMLGLAHQGSPAGNFEVILPASVIPECCSHHFGEGHMSYWVRKSFLDVPLCLVSEMEDEGKLKEDCCATFRISVRINSIPILKFSVTRECYKISNHARLIHLHSYISECSLAELGNSKNLDTFLQLEWNHVEILWKVDFFQPTEGFDLGFTGPGRVHIWGNQPNAEDILFSKPPEFWGRAASPSPRGNKKVNSDGGSSFEFYGNVDRSKVIMEDRLVNSSSSFRNQYNFDVYLSFGGVDTRRTFTGHLYNALRQKGIHVFIDGELPGTGEEISPALLKVIEESRISIIIFSENYATSTWCLQELTKVLECRQINGQIVYPVYYNVDPSDVRHQRGSFGEAMAEHECRRCPDVVHKWRSALTTAANLSGWDFGDFGDGYEFKFIDQIVEAVSRLLNRTPLSVAAHPVGLESQISELISHIDRGFNDAQMIGIFGVGGIGKTTLAKAMYNIIADQFEVASFLADVGERSCKGGLLRLQEEYTWGRKYQAE